MKIGLDLRFLKEDDLYSDFVIEMITKLVIESDKNTYNIYVNNNLLNIKSSKYININTVNIGIWSIKEQISFNKILNKDDNNLVLFFNIHKPLLYKKDYYLFIGSLNKVYYQNFKSLYKKHRYLYLLNKSTKNAQKIICFDENTKDELSERLDIKEEKIYTITPFFTWAKKHRNITPLNIDIKTKNNITNDFLIYNWWVWIEKNIDRLVKVIHELNDNNKKIDLIILWDDIAWDLKIRDLIISENMQNNIHFLWRIKDEEKIHYYNSSIWVIFPSLYESFPFHLNEAIFYNTNIIAGNIKSIKNILWDSISYFFPISTSNMIENTTLFLNKKTKINYKNILNKINPENTIKELIKIIN